MASKNVALGLTGLFVVFLVVLVGVQVMKPREGFRMVNPVQASAAYWAQIKAAQEAQAAQTAAMSKLFRDAKAAQDAAKARADARNACISRCPAA